MAPLKSVYCKKFCFDFKKDNHDIRIKKHALEINVDILPSGEKNIFHHEKCSADYYACTLERTKDQDKEVLTEIIPTKVHVRDASVETEERDFAEYRSLSSESLTSDGCEQRKKRKNLGLVSAREWKWQGPPWYTNLSPVQISAVEALPDALKADIEEKVHYRTLGVLLAMGLTPNLNELKKAMLSCVSTDTRAIGADRKLARKIANDSSLHPKDNKRCDRPDGNAKGNCSVKAPNGKGKRLPTAFSKIQVEGKVFRDLSFDSSPKTVHKKDAPRQLQSSGPPRAKNEGENGHLADTPQNSPYSPESPAEIQVDAVAFLMSLYTALGGCKGKVWLSEEPQRDRLLLSSAAHLQLPTTLRRLHSALPRRLRTDLRAFGNHESDSRMGQRKKGGNSLDKVERSLKVLQKLINEEKEPHHPSPYLAKPFLPTPQHPPERKKVPAAGDGKRVDSSTSSVAKQTQVIDEVKRALVEVGRKFRDPIARLPFLWKHPDLKLWLDARRRAADPQFSAKRSKVTPLERRMTIRGSEYEWDQMKACPYKLHSPKLPKEVRRGEPLSMKDFEKARRKSMKVRQDYITRLKRTVIEESRDYWPTMSPPLPDPRPWKKKPQRPPFAPPPPNFSHVFYAYMPVREKDIIV